MLSDKRVAFLEELLKQPDTGDEWEDGWRDRDLAKAVPELLDEIQRLKAELDELEARQCRSCKYVAHCNGFNSHNLMCRKLVFYPPDNWVCGYWESSKKPESDPITREWDTSEMRLARTVFDGTESEDAE